MSQVKVLNGEDERAEARELLSEIAKKFGLEPEIKEALQKYLPVKKESH